MVPVEVFRLFPIVICVISIESNFNFSIVCNTEYRVSIRITPMTILPPDFSLFSHSSTISFVSPPVPPIKIAMPDFPEPTSYGLTKNFYFDKFKIIKKIKLILKINKKLKIENEIKKPDHHDIPGEWFTGPF